MKAASTTPTRGTLHRNITTSPHPRTRAIHPAPSLPACRELVHNHLQISRTYGEITEDHWKPDYASPEPDSTRHQVNQALAILNEHSLGQRLFQFINISATHVPHHHYLPGSNGHDNWDSQYAALTYTDPHIGRLLNALPEHGDWLTIACSDHGDAFGEDGYTGHGITHPTVYTVPYTEALLEPT